MLRQQQAKIEALKLQLHTTLTNRDLRTYDGKLNMNNEPVAWMLLGLEDRKPKLINLQVIDHLEGTWIPLYTHPAKTLTDEEILVLAETYKNGWVENNFERQLFMDAEALVLFARAILRKAQEK